MNLVNKRNLFGTLSSKYGPMNEIFCGNGQMKNLKNYRMRICLQRSLNRGNKLEKNMKLCTVFVFNIPNYLRRNIYRLMCLVGFGHCSLLDASQTHGECLVLFHGLSWSTMRMWIVHMIFTFKESQFQKKLKSRLNTKKKW